MLMESRKNMTGFHTEDFLFTPTTSDQAHGFILAVHLVNNVFSGQFGLSELLETWTADCGGKWTNKSMYYSIHGKKK